MFYNIQKTTKGNIAFIIDKDTVLSDLPISPDEQQYIESQIKIERYIVQLNRFSHQLYFVFISHSSEEEYQKLEFIRKQGAALQSILKLNKYKDIFLSNRSNTEKATYCLAEGIGLSAYQFLKYKSDAKKKTNTLSSVFFDKNSITPTEVKRLQVISDAIYHARDLVNEPLHYLTAEQLSQEISRIGKEGLFKVSVYGKAKIEQLGMGGLLAVNKGSQLPPTFTIMEHRPIKPINKTPIVLVGKGVVYDTGGLSLKPTPNSMDSMKSDMSGAAVVTGVMYAVGQLDLPLHVIALIPATENRPGENAYVPGDVIKMYSGASVEVLNTDAEGRLILADALHYAKKYKPELVIDFATLTGAASVAIGDVGIVCMGNASEAHKQQLKISGYAQYERLVEYPLWSEYDEMIQSDIADLKNIGGPKGGAITAGKFLEHFTDYPWMHMDIAGVSFLEKGKDYRTAGGTAYGIRLMVDFLMNYPKL